MTPVQRERVLLEILDALSDPSIAMSEGRPHKKAKSQAVDTLGLHFRSTGRAIYIAEEMVVLYPGEKPFSPDVLAVLDVPQPEDDPRMAWVVVDEGKGLDLVIEVLHHGDRNKDLVENVEHYAYLGIPEYFVYDRARQQIHGYHLPSPGASRYQRLVPQLGRYRSAVLGLDLMIVGDDLRFLYGMAELPGSADLISRLEGMMESVTTKARAQIEQAQAQAEQAQARAEQAQAQAQQALAGLQDAILALLGARRIPCPDEARARVRSCIDPPSLQRWLLRATTAGSVEEVLSGDVPPPRE
jgi:Uma2 family endonuclease